MRKEQIGTSTLFHCDCMELMKQYPDKHFQLAIIDPPYGIGNHSLHNFRSHGRRECKYDKRINEWDIAPEPEYFQELFRVSKYHIIWGGNYFNLPPSRNFIIYNKTNISDNICLSQCEYAWTNIQGNSKIYNHFPKPNNGRIHPTEKPISLYKWLLSKYAKQGDKILDTHFGSGSIAVACYDMGFDLTASEIDEDYYNAAVNRLKQFAAQGTLDFSEAV